MAQHPLVGLVARDAGLDIREPYPGFILIPGFDKYLGVDANTVIHDLDTTIPSRGNGDTILPGEVQWVRGDHPKLRYRGNELLRRKVWAQKGPVAQGTRIYSYTGFTYPVALATSNWQDSPLLNTMSEKMNTFMGAIGGPEMNHLIVTAYDSGSHNIGFHYDKERSLLPGSWIAVLKLGPSSRRFALRARDAQDQKRQPMLFDEVVSSGTLILMSMSANLETQHGVPVTDDESVGLSGSVVWRNVTTLFSPGKLTKRIALTEKGVKRREKKRREKKRREKKRRERRWSA